MKFGLIFAKVGSNTSPWLLKEFGRTNFSNVAYVSFDNEPVLRQTFERGYDMPRILEDLQAVTGERIREGETLSAYVDAQAFKIFMVDVGLLGAMAGLDESSVVDGSAIFTEFKGALTEQYVCQQLVGDLGARPYYWSASNSSGEIDFLVQRGPRVAAIEVKAEENLRAKSLRAFKEKNPEVAALRLSLSGYREQDWMRNVPLYAVGNEALWG